MVLERAWGEPLGQHAHALADMVGDQVSQAHMADDLHACLDAAGSCAVRGRFDVHLVFFEPAFRVVLQIRGFHAGQQAGAFHLRDPLVEPFARLRLRFALGGYESSSFRGGSWSISRRNSHVPSLRWMMLPAPFVRRLPSAAMMYLPCRERLRASAASAP